MIVYDCFLLILLDAESVTLWHFMALFFNFDQMQKVAIMQYYSKSFEFTYKQFIIFL